MNIIELEKCCRTCLKDQQINTMKLLSTNWTDTMSFADMLMDIIKFPKDDIKSDEFSLKICTTCEQKLITAYNFKICCQNTEKILSEQILPTQLLSIEQIKFESYKEEDIDIDDDFDQLHQFDNEQNQSIDMIDFSEDSKPLIELKTAKHSKKPKSSAKIANKKSKSKSNETIKQKSVKKFNATKQLATDDPDSSQLNDTIEDNSAIANKSTNPPKTKRVRKSPRKPTVYCSKCDIKFETGKEYVRHRKETHLNETNVQQPKKKRIRGPQKPTVHCLQCDITFETNKDYVRHRREIHWTSYPCTLCGKLFFESTIDKHMLTHTDEKNEICSVCGARFPLEYSLKLHMRIHTNEKRYKCDFCDERFIHWNSKKNHMYLKHTREKKYECYICHRRFGQNSVMKTHVRYHTGNLPYPCPFCNKGFPSPSKLKRHALTHREVSAEQLAPYMKKT